MMKASVQENVWKEQSMSQVTEELNFMWRERLSDYYEECRESGASESMEAIRTVLKLQGLTVKGIEG